MAVGKAVYQVLEKDGHFEIRMYEPMVLAISRETDLRGYSGFNVLFSYISGNNQASKKISMTAPVLNNLDEQNLTTSFVMPNQYKHPDELPQPADPALKLREIPSRKVAAILFSGNASKRLISQKQAELLDWLKKRQLVGVGPVELARYNPPFLPGFVKRNEILIEIEPMVPDQSSKPSSETI